MALDAEGCSYPQLLASEDDHQHLSEIWSFCKLSSGCGVFARLITR